MPGRSCVSSNTAPAQRGRGGEISLSLAKPHPTRSGDPRSINPSTGQDPEPGSGQGQKVPDVEARSRRSQNFPGLESSCTEIGGHWLRVPSVDTDVQQHQLPPGSSTRSAEARSAASWPARRRFSAASSVITYQKILPISIDRMARVRYVRDAMRSQLRTFPRAHGPSRRSLRTSCSPFEKKRRSLGTRCRRQDK